MMPEEWPSMRSMARCVLPVLVGPSTAVTPAPGARSEANEEGEKAIWCRFFLVQCRRHCEEQSDEAIHPSVMPRNGLLRCARDDGCGRPASIPPFCFTLRR